MLISIIVYVMAQVGVAWSTSDDWQPMVAFICNKTAMHRGLHRWISDDLIWDCHNDNRKILHHCQKVYPSHNITNIVEYSHLVSIEGWPSIDSARFHTHRVRPYRCLDSSFQVDALLVPRPCRFDYSHPVGQCLEQSHWAVVAHDMCYRQNRRCDSFGMLYSCGIGKFSGVEYVCCPIKHTEEMSIPPVVHLNAHAVMDSNNDEDDYDDDGVMPVAGLGSSPRPDGQQDVGVVTPSVYELYLRGGKLPVQLSNEHQQFMAARRYMQRIQERKNSQLMKEWDDTRDRVFRLRKTDPKAAEKLNKDISERYQRLYSAYDHEDVAEKLQVVALHQQRVQAKLNQRKRVTMDRFLRALDNEDAGRVYSSLKEYMSAEEKDMQHTVRHFGHVSRTDRAEAGRIRDHVIRHLSLCQRRMEQALQELESFPEIETRVRPEIEAFLLRYSGVADSIRDIVMPGVAVTDKPMDIDSVPRKETVVFSQDDVQPGGKVTEEGERFNAQPTSAMESAAVGDDNRSGVLQVAGDVGSKEAAEHEHDFYSRRQRPVARHQQDNVRVSQAVHQHPSALGSVRLGTGLGLAIGSGVMLVILIVAMVMFRRRHRRSKRRSGATGGGYVEVDRTASAEERHVASMQMNGYENPTYRYFEVQVSGK